MVHTLVSFLLPGAFGASAAAAGDLSFLGDSAIFCRLSSVAGVGGGGAPFCTCLSFGFSGSFILLSFGNSAGASVVSCSLGVGSEEDAMDKDRSRNISV